jgi:hypothetical protein
MRGITAAGKTIMTTNKRFKADARTYAATHGISYTAARRALLAAAGAEHAPDLLVIDPFTGCWRSWSQASVASLEPEMADDGEWLYSDVHIAGEVFRNDGTLQVVRGRDAVAAWLKELGGAPVGSRHSDSDAGSCRVCHDDYHYDYVAPETLALLEHRAHQIAAAYERLVGVEIGSAIEVRAERNDEGLLVMLALTDTARTGRLLGLEWRSERAEWYAIAAADATQTTPSEERSTLLGCNNFTPRSVAADLDSARRHYS